MDTASPLPHHDRTDDLVRLLESHACNATLHVAGHPSFGPEDWIRHCTLAAGGFLGRVAWDDGMTAFIAFVPSGEDDPGRRTSSPDPEEFCAWPETIMARRLRRMVDTLSLLAGEAAVEASASMKEARVDLVRGTFRLPWAAEPKAEKNPPSPLAPKSAAALAERIRSGRGDGGFLLSETDKGEFLAIVAGEGTLSEAAVLQPGGRLSLPGCPDIVLPLSGREAPERIPLLALKKAG